MITTEGWVLHEGARDEPRPSAVEDALHYESFSFPEPDDDEALVEPLYGSWEANLDHALARDPIDVCHLRGEASVVVGNLGLVRVLRPPARSSTTLREGDVCMVMPFGRCDRHGYAIRVWAYDMPGTVGLLVKRTKVHGDILLPVPEDTRHSLLQWAVYARYFTAWDNWNVAFGCWRAQLPDADPADHLVFGWGGGVSLAELQLAQEAGFEVAMTASSDDRLAHVRQLGLQGVDRRQFAHLGEWNTDDEARTRRYRASERVFLDTVDALSGGAGVAIFVDNIGAPLYKATLKALSREGVLTTVGWKHGMDMLNRRATECISRHLHVHTHVWRLQDSPRIRDQQEDTDWIAQIDLDAIYDFDDVPYLARDYREGKISTYFPLYQVNPE